MAFNLTIKYSDQIEKMWNKSAIITPEMYSRNYTGNLMSGSVQVDLFALGEAMDHQNVANTTNGTGFTSGVEESIACIVRVKDTNREVDGAQEDSIQGNLEATIVDQSTMQQANAFDKNFYTSLIGSGRSYDLSNASATTASTVLTVIESAKLALDKANAPLNRRYLVGTPEFCNLLLNNDKITSNFTPAGADALANGIVGRIFGFEIKQSNIISSVNAALEFVSWQADGIAADFMLTTMEVNKVTNKVNVVAVQSQAREFAEVIQEHGCVFNLIG
jgi:hypothetical protein